MIEAIARGSLIKSVAQVTVHQWCMTPTETVYMTPSPSHVTMSTPHKIRLLVAKRRRCNGPIVSPLFQLGPENTELYSYLYFVSQKTS